MFEELVDLGMTKNEITVYLALLKEGHTTAGTIVELSGLHRVIVYDKLKILIKKGLVSYNHINNVKQFYAQDITSLKNIIEREKQILENKTHKIEKIIPKLQQINNPISSNHAHIYSGVNATKKVLELIRNSVEKEHYVIGSGAKSEEALGLTFWNNYFQKIKAKKYKEYILVNQDHKDNTIMSSKPRTEIRRLPKELSQHTELVLFDQKVAIFTYGEPPTVVLIDNKQIYLYFKMHFDFIWQQAK